MELVFDNRRFRIQAMHPPRAGGGGRVLLSFTGIGHEMGGIDLQKPEFYAIGAGFDNVVFVSDLTRSWGNALNFRRIQTELAPYVKGARLFTIGNSMGGFLAVLATAFFKVEATIALAAQYSVSPDIVPEETRWRAHRSGIKRFRFESLETAFNDTTRYYMFSGGNADEKVHWSRFPDQPNVHNIVLGQRGHHIAQYLKGQNVLSPLVTACVGDAFSVEWLNDIQSVPARRA